MKQINIDLQYSLFRVNYLYLVDSDIHVGTEL